MHNISVIPTLISKVITKLDLPKASRPRSITVAVLKNYEPNPPYTERVT